MLDQELEQLVEHSAPQPHDFSLRDLARKAVEDHEGMQAAYIRQRVQETVIEVLAVPFPDGAIRVESYGGPHTEGRAMIDVEGMEFKVRVSNICTDNESCALEMFTAAGTWTRVDSLLDVGHELRKIEEKEARDAVKAAENAAQPHQPANID